MSSSGGENPPPLLHGDLELTIHEARGLPNMDFLSTLLRGLCFCPGMSPGTGRRRSARSVPRGDDDHHQYHHHYLHRPHLRHKPQPHGRHILPTSDPYAAVVVPPDITLARTHVVRNSEAPDWSTTVVLQLAHFTSSLLFQVKDADPFGSDVIGIATLPSDDILSATPDKQPVQSRWLTLLRPDGRGTPKPDSAIRISATFVPAARTTGWSVPAYFPPRRGCAVRLYQDAHVAAGELEGVSEPGRCWEDLCLAVLGAQHLVYVAGWSVDTEVRLLREAMSPEMAEKAAEVRALAGVDVREMTLGQLLKYKSQEGVRVCLLVWDDRSGGLMRTKDEDTKRFFRHSSVICVLSPRYPSSKLSMVKQHVVGTLYTHHQKCVLVDTPASESTRRITAFLGGLDLCSGRYDTPSHRLFRDLGTVFRGDVYNPTFFGGNAGPRQPWHDMHCRLDGPAAYDVLSNFEQRWRKTTKLRAMFGKKSRRKDDALLRLERIRWIHSPTSYDARSAAVAKDEDQHALRVLPEEDPECWHAQVFRSIDAGSVKGLPRPWETDEMVSALILQINPAYSTYHRTPNTQVQRNLLCDQNVAVEQSIHAAYVRAIRSADRFIYIENQYFIGSSYAWPAYRHPGAGNLVPMEIALKVAAKIRARQPFAAYVVIPMWPEGNPASAPAQEILFWQRQTMETMYRVVAAELNLHGGSHPQDYLNFYCLGTREEEEEEEEGDGGGHTPPPDRDNTSPAARARRHRRFMVYVHSKGMIVDDEYVIVGSANINQRSLAGSRDTEIAVGAYQPRHGAARGRVHGYRMSLWEEHLGREVVRRPEVDRPESPDCVRMVNRVARENWERYTADDAVALQGHLMKYPVHVSADGKVGPLQGWETFPDVGGRILGSPTNLPDYLTM